MKSINIIMLVCLMAAILPSCMPGNRVVRSHFEPLVYQHVIDAPGKSSSELMVLANRWAVESYASYQSVFHYRDSSYLAINALTSLRNRFAITAADNTSKTFDYDYQIIVEARPERARVTVHRYQDHKTGIGVYSLKSELDDIRSSKLAKPDRDLLNREVNERHKILEEQKETLLQSLKNKINAPFEKW